MPLLMHTAKLDKDIKDLQYCVDRSFTAASKCLLVSAVNLGVWDTRVSAGLL